MVISQFDPLVGGAEKQAKLLARALTEKGERVSIVTGWWKCGTPRREEIHGVRVFRNFACWGMFGVKGLRPIGVLAYAISLGIFLLIRRNEYDVIHVHQALYPAFVAVFVGKRILKKPVIVKSASSGMTGDIVWMKRFPLGTFQLRYLLKRLDYLIAVSRVTGAEFEAAGFPSERLLYIPNGVAVFTGRKIGFDLQNVLVTIARLSLEKGIDVLLNAFAICRRMRSNLRLVIVGDGPLRSELEQMSRTLGVSDYVNFMGMLDDIGDCLRAADLFVLPSRTEGMSNALLEAMGYGVPCVATAVGGNKELLGGGDGEIERSGYVVGENGVLVNPEDAEGLANASLYLMDRKELREKLGGNARSFVKGSHSIDSVAERYIDLYRHLLRERN